MKIEKIKITSSGFINCKSRFYTSHCTLDETTSFSFNKGVNKMTGDIDSECWAISYLMPMYQYAKNKDIVCEQASVLVNDKNASLLDLSKVSCYMDPIYPLFSTKKPVEKLIAFYIKKNHLKYTPLEIKNLFKITDDRFKRPFNQTGNEIFKVMAAIGFVNNMQAYCFPWLSKKRFNYYHKNLSELITILENLNLTVLLPLGD